MSVVNRKAISSNAHTSKLCGVALWQCEMARFPHGKQASRPPTLWRGRVCFWLMCSSHKQLVMPVQ